jgi:hypothetical protein
MPIAGTPRTTVCRIALAFGTAMSAICACAAPDVLTAQATKPSKAPMDTDGMSQKPGMRSMMGAPLPFGIMIGRAEQWMVGYQYMAEKLNGLLDGTDAISQADVLTRFATTPTKMTMQTHMAMLMYAPADRFTVMAMVPYVAMSMGELHGDGTRSTERSKGIGDLEVRGLYSLYATKDLRHRLLASFGVGLPTGSINLTDAEGARLEYPMQTGSGTFSLLPGVTYLGEVRPWSWGVELNATERIGRNAHGYRLGNRVEPDLWIERSLTPALTLSTGARGEWWGNVNGSDASLDPTDEPTKDANIQGGKRLNALVGVTVQPPNGFLSGQQVLIQGDVPVWQSLDGPQLKRSFMVHVAWQWGF